MARYCIVFHTDKKLKLRRRFLDEALFLCGLFCGRRRAAGCLRHTEYISAAAQATATPTSSTSRTQKSDSTVKVNETAAKVEVVTAQSSATPSATAAPAPAETPATGDFPVMYLAGVVGLILICSAGLLMLRKI